MKSNQLILAALMMFGGLFTACDDNNGGNGGGGANSEAKVVADDYEAWTYFDFETGTTQTLPINKEEGAVTGLYTGTLKGSGMFADYVNLEDVSVSITRVNADSVEVSAMDLTMSMSGEEVEPFTLTTRAEAKLENGVWTLSGGKQETLVGETIYKFAVSGTIGTKEGDAVNLTFAIQPGAMPMDITAAYTSTVTGSYTYEVDAAAEAALPFQWDIAVHKYDIRTNGGSAKELSKTDLDAVTMADAESGLVADEMGEVIADMSNMMSGFVGYQDVALNPELANWVIATPTGSMPPYTYELNSNCFVVSVNGKVWKMKFTAYNSMGKTAACFDYEEVK